MTTETALNVWTEDPESGWLMAIYLTNADGVDTSRYFSFTPNKDQLDRYFDISHDTDWWVYSNDPEYYEILFGYVK